MKLVNKERAEIYDDVVGLLTIEELQRLKEVPRKCSLHKNIPYTWNCALCGNKYFYAVMRCPACESAKIEKVTRTVKPEV